MVARRINGRRIPCRVSMAEAVHLALSATLLFHGGTVVVTAYTQHHAAGGRRSILNFRAHDQHSAKECAGRRPWPLPLAARKRHAFSHDESSIAEFKRTCLSARKDGSNDGAEPAAVVGDAKIDLSSFSASSNGTIRSSPGVGRDAQAEIAVVPEDYSYSSSIQRTLAAVSAASGFGALLWYLLGSETGEAFFAGYLVELSLSVDNLFVFLLLFDYFKVPLASQDRVLNWGIYGAIIMRGIMIGLGVVAIKSFRPVLLVFAAILIFSSAKIFLGVGEDEDEDEAEGLTNNPVVNFAREVFNATETYDGDRFFTSNGFRQATPLFICMVALEISDVVFAVDSVPAVFGVTEDPLVVFSSNMFAILGLRSLYTVLSKAASDLKYLEPAVAVVLGFIGCKMVGQFFGYEIPINIALLVVTGLIGTGVGASILARSAEEQRQQQ